MPAHVKLSRARRADRAWALRPFSPWLFQRGPPTGPHILLRRLRGDLSVESAEKLWCSEEEGDEDEEKKRDPMEQQYRCMHCCLEGRHCMKKPQSFGVHKASDLLRKLFMDGVWTRCQDCCARLAGAPHGAGPQGAELRAAEAARRESARLAAEQEEGAAPRTTCTVCRVEKALEEFPISLEHHRDRAHRRCKACHRCPECQQLLSATGFEPDTATCKACARKA